MATIQWNDEASLMRVTPVRTAGDQLEELVARGTAYELVGAAIEMTPDQQAGLLLRQATADDVLEYDANAIRELAASGDYTGAEGEFDQDDGADGLDRGDLAEVPDEETLVDGETSGPSHTNSEGLDGER